MLNFADALSDLKKKNRLMGKPVSQQEVAGVAEGYSREATGRLSTALQAKQAADTLAEQKRQHEEQMAMNEEDRKAAEEASEKETMMSGALGGAMLGAKYGATAGPWGAIGGAIGGLALGKLSKSCIIITACTSRNSHEVEISREFRDKYMSPYHLGGYYALAEAVAPLIKKYTFLRLITKRFLVDRLVDYGEWILEYKPERRLRTSRIVTAGFLSLCAAIGMRIDVHPLIDAHR